MTEIERLNELHDAEIKGLITVEEMQSVLNGEQITTTRMLVLATMIESGGITKQGLVNLIGRIVEAQEQSTALLTETYGGN